MNPSMVFSSILFPLYMYVLLLLLLDCCTVVFNTKIVF